MIRYTYLPSLGTIRLALVSGLQKEYFEVVFIPELEESVFDGQGHEVSGTVLVLGVEEDDPVIVECGEGHLYTEALLSALQAGQLQVG